MSRAKYITSLVGTVFEGLSIQVPVRDYSNLQTAVAAGKHPYWDLVKGAGHGIAKGAGFGLHHAGKGTGAATEWVGHTMQAFPKLAGAAALAGGYAAYRYHKNR